MSILKRRSRLETKASGVPRLGVVPRQGVHRSWVHRLGVMSGYPEGEGVGAQDQGYPDKGYLKENGIHRLWVLPAVDK